MDGHGCRGVCVFRGVVPPSCTRGRSFKRAKVPFSAILSDDTSSFFALFLFGAAELSLSLIAQWNF